MIPSGVLNSKVRGPLKLARGVVVVGEEVDILGLVSTTRWRSFVVTGLVISR